MITDEFMLRILTPSEFLSAVWPKKLLTNETLELRVINRKSNSRKREFAFSIGEFLDKAKKYPGWDVYFGVSTRFGTTSGKKRDCYRLNTVWVDFDGMNLAGLKSLSPKPDMLVDSGGGVHAYWILTNPVLVRHNEKFKEVESINRGLCERFGGDDQAIDISRILRVPSFLNHKYDPPRTVKAYAL